MWGQASLRGADRAAQVWRGSDGEGQGKPAGVCPRHDGGTSRPRRGGLSRGVAEAWVSGGRVRLFLEWSAVE